MKRHNLHVHTTFSDGSLSLEEAVIFAGRGGLDIVGICDHAFTRKPRIHTQITSNIGDYLTQIASMNNHLDLPPLGRVKVLAGAEIDLSARYGIDPALLPFDALNSFDYLFFEYVNTQNESGGWINGRGIARIVHVRPKIKVPIGLAHNDLQKNYHGKEEEICKILSDNDIFVEINQSEIGNVGGVGRNTRDGKDYYHHFSKKLLDCLVKYSVKVVTGTDAHTGVSIGSLNGARKFIHDHHLFYHPLVNGKEEIGF